MPQVVIVDEIGCRAEAEAADSIAARGVALVATAHGTCLADLLKNGQLAGLLGGVHSVLLSAGEAAAAAARGGGGGRRTVRERKQAPVFAAAVELVSPREFIVHSDVQAAVDACLRGERPPVERRTVDEAGVVWVEDSEARNPLIGRADEE